MEETHELQKRFHLHIDFFYWDFSIQLIQSYQHAKPPTITKLNHPIQVQTKEFYTLSISFLLLPRFFLDGGFMKLPHSLPSQTRHCVLHFSLADVYYAHPGWKRQQQYDVGWQLLHILDHKQQGRSPAFSQPIEHQGILPNHPAPLSPLRLLASNVWQAIPSPLLQLSATTSKKSYCID